MMDELAVTSLREGEDHATRVRAEQETIQQILGLNDLLPTPQLPPQQLRRAQPLALGECSAGAPKELPQAVLPPVPEGRRADTCETLVVTEGVSLRAYYFTHSCCPWLHLPGGR